MAAEPDDVARLRAEVALVRLVESAGVELTGRAGHQRGDCPACSTVAGLTVDAKANTFSCAGCAAAGSVVEWVQLVEGVSERHAIELLREGGPTREVRRGARLPKVGSKALLASPVRADADDATVLADVVGFYHRTLLEAADAKEFLARRRIDSAEVVGRFRVGFANRTLGYRLPNNQRAEGRQIRSRLQDLGVLAGSGHEAFRGSLVVPIVDEAGAVVQLYGRKVGSGLRKGTALHTWLASPSRPLFNVEVLGRVDEVVVCGSVLDALTFITAGIEHAVALAGPTSFDDSHLDQLVEHGVGRVLFAFRRDQVGDDQAQLLADKLAGHGVESHRVVLPDGADVNDYACISESPADALARAVRSATWLAGTRRSTRSAPEPVEPGPVTSDVVDEEPLLVSPVPAAPGPEVVPDLSADGDEMRVVFGARSWRLRGLARNTSFDVLRVNVLVAVPHVERGAGFHVDTLDLYSARARSVFTKEAAVELAVDEKILKRDLGRVLMAAEALVEEAIRRAQQPADTTVHLDPDERRAALELLTDTNLVERIVADFAKVGMVGEATNCLVGYLATVSRKLEQPLAVIVQSTSAAGKSALMEAVLEFVPAEERIKYSAMTGQSLYYLGESDLAHKVLAIAEEEGAERASYALKLLQSEGELSIASTGKDTSSGRLVTHEYKVTGPAAIFLTTTAIDIDEELLNRCVVLTVDEDRAQTRAIHVRQRRGQTLDGLLAANTREAVLKVHRDAQRLLEPVAVVNPFADRLGFADAATRTRRDHVKYLTLIRSIALLHQHQRDRHTATTAGGQQVVYIEATIDDIALANRLAHEVLGRSLDELPPQTRRLLDALDTMVVGIAEDQSIDRDRVRFTRRQVRERLGWGDTQLKVHLARLVDLELVWAHRAERSGAFVYELAWHPTTAGNDGEAGGLGRFCPGLVDVATLTGDASSTATTGDRSGLNGDRSGSTPPRSAPGRGLVGGRSAPGRTGAEGSNGQVNGHKPDGTTANGADHASGVVDGNGPSYDVDVPSGPTSGEAG